LRVHARIFDTFGDPVTDPFQVSTSDDPWPYFDFLAEVEADAGGSFVVAWSREITLGPTGSHFASRYTRDGDHEWTAEPVWYYAGMVGQGFSMTPSGDFVDVWGDLDGVGMTAGCFTHTGQPSFEPWGLGSGGYGSHVGFQVDHQDDAPPHFVVVWQGQGDVFGLRNLRLFADGFESGDTGFWSARPPS
jgi:hypothetical protein